MMLNKFKGWCSKERIGRPEEGTSQDIFPTNGDALILYIFTGFIVLVFIIAIIIT